MTDMKMKDVIAEFPVSVDKMDLIKTNVYKLKGTRQMYCLKYYGEHQKLETIHHILRVLHQRRFTKCNQVIATRTNQDYVLDRNGGWQLTKWVHGRQPDFKNRNHLRDALYLLAEFHQVAHTIPFVQTGNSSQRYNSLFQQWEERYHDLVKWRSKYESQYLEKAAELARKSLDVLQKKHLNTLIKREKQQRAIVHGDFNFPNLIRKRNGQIVMIDFENSAHDVRIHDLVHIIQRNVYQNIDEAKWMIARYENRRPLDSHERAVLAALLAFPYQFWRSIHIRRQHRQVVSKQLIRNWGNQYISRHYSNYWTQHAGL